ncbi:hypothetical protein CC2G_010179 [Coprinopsis cinerea AmutBmut pab1-1]|nr:hypothetical protein CC2G_010179 [Coprinopsis cinerea AmutBmut pab1-1]
MNGLVCAWETRSGGWWKFERFVVGGPELESAHLPSSHTHSIAPPTLNVFFPVVVVAGVQLVVSHDIKHIIYPLFVVRSPVRPVHRHVSRVVPSPFTTRSTHSRPPSAPFVNTGNTITTTIALNIVGTLLARC